MQTSAGDDGSTDRRSSRPTSAGAGHTAPGDAPFPDAFADRMARFLVTDRPAFARYGAVVAAVALSLAVSFPTLPVIERGRFMFFWPVVIFAALFGGRGPALLASVLSVLAVDYFFVPPVYRFVPEDAADLVPLTIFVLTSSALGALTGALRAEQRRTAAAAAENATLASRLEHQTLELEQQAMELEQQLEESQVLQEELELSSAELAERTAAAEAADRYSRGILESITDPFVVLDPEWRLRFVNPPAEAVLASALTGGGGVEGADVWTLYPGARGTPFELDLRRAAAERTPTSFEAFYPESARWTRVHAFPLPDGDLAVQWKDVTAERRAEEADRYLARATEVLASSLDYERTLAELARLVVPELADWCAVDMAGPGGHPQRLAVVHVDPDKVRLAHELHARYPVDPSAPTGVPRVLRTGEPEFYPDIPDELLVVAAQDADHLRIMRELGLRSAIVVPLISQGQTLGALSLVAAESGRRYTAEDLGLATELARRAALAVDNARRHRAEQAARAAAEKAQGAAEEANEAKSRFLATMSHELRTPLNAIDGYAELIELGIHGSVTDAQRDALGRIRRAQRHLLSLINDVLNYAKIEAGHVVFDMADVPVLACVESVEPLLQPQLAAKRLAYERGPCDPALAVRADAEKLAQVLINLLSNAVKFTEPGGRVTLGFEAADDHVRLTIADTGIGIAPDKLQSVFEPFVQLGRTLTTPQEGTGLGLAISRDLARGMGGDLTAESGLGAGSRFVLTLRRS